MFNGKVILIIGGTGSFGKKYTKTLLQRYDKAFQNSLVKPLYTFDGKSSYHLYVVQVDFDKLKLSKEEFFNKMRQNNIGLQVHYIPINKQLFYKNLGYGDENTPIMDNYYELCFSLLKLYLRFWNL